MGIYDAAGMVRLGSSRRLHRTWSESGLDDPLLEGTPKRGPVSTRSFLLAGIAAVLLLAGLWLALLRGREAARVLHYQAQAPLRQLEAQESPRVAAEAAANAAAASRTLRFQVCNGESWTGGGALLPRPCGACHATGRGRCDSRRA